MEVMGLGKYITKEKQSISVKTMGTLPDSKEKIGKKKNTIFVVLTGWRGMYNIHHPRFFVSAPWTNA